MLVLVSPTQHDKVFAPGILQDFDSMLKLLVVVVSQPLHSESTLQLQSGGHCQPS